MTIAEQIKLVKKALEDWGGGAKATVAIAQHPIDFFTQLRTGPGKLRAVIMFRGEDKRGEYEEAGVVDRKFWIGLSRGKGLQLNQAEALIDESGAGPALYDLIEEVRQVVRGLEFAQDTTEVTPDYKGFNPFEVEGWLLDAYNLEFWIGTQLPGV